MDSPPTHAGPYKLLHLLGRGGSASVYAAEHEAGGPRVALKLLSPESSRDPHLVARFRQQAQVLTQLQHPGIVRVLDLVDHGGTVFLTMEYLEGQSLREWMGPRTEPLPLGVLLELGARIADILVEVHARGFVHRDLKPENIFLCPPEEDSAGPHVKLLDFGIAKLPLGTLDARGATLAHTHESAFIGTYPYMAPEQFRSAARVDASADVYSLGVVLFELLAGHVPFQAEEPIEVIAAHANEVPPSLHRLVPTLSPRLCAFLTSMLVKEPARRPSMRRCLDMLRRDWTKEPEPCPLPGLASFTEAQAELFFGRDEELQELLSRLDELHAGTRRWLQVEGPSGVGKSSLLHAGVLPRLARMPGWRVVCLRPHDEPVRALARALASGPGPEGTRLLLVLEPLEDLFALGTAECRGLDDLLGAALEAPDSPVRLLTCVRTDFLHRFGQLPALTRLLPGASRFSLLPMESEALTKVIQGMAYQTGLRLAPALDVQMVRDARGEAGRMALLGHALRGLWLSSGGAALTHADYERLGGVGGSLAQQAEALLEGLGPEGRERARWMLLSLVRTGRGVSDTRRPRSRREVLAAGGDDALAETVLLRLSGMSSEDPAVSSGMRLLQFTSADPSAEPQVELVHDLLLHRVGTLATWIEEARDRLVRRADLETAAHAWIQAKEPVDGLPTGTLLQHYREGAGPLSGHLGERSRVGLEVTRFLEAGRRLERRRARARAASAVAAGLAVLAILFYAALARREREVAEAALVQAKTALGQAEAALGQVIEMTEKFAGGSDWTLSWLPYTLELRRAMLQGFREGLEKLTPHQRALPKVREVFIKLLHRQADLAFHDADLKQAWYYLDEASGLLREALAEAPRDDGLLWLLALNHSKRGKVEQARGELGPACTHFVEAVRQMEQPTADGEGRVGDPRALAVSQTELADCDIAARQWDAAAERLDKAIVIHRGNAAAYYDEALLAEALARRGEVAQWAGQPERARAFFVDALSHARHSTESASSGDQYSRWALAQVLVKDARFRGKEGAGEMKEARELAKALRGGERLSKRYALVWLEAVAGQEALSPEQAAQLRGERCALARDFLDKDGEDVRFVFADCPSARPQGDAP